MSSKDKRIMRRNAVDLTGEFSEAYERLRKKASKTQGGKMSVKEASKCPTAVEKADLSN